MTVAELIAKLREFPPDTQVGVASGLFGGLGISYVKLNPREAGSDLQAWVEINGDELLE